MRRIIWFTFADVWASFAPAAFASVGVALAIAATRAVLVGDVPTPVTLAVEVVTGALALALCVRFCPVPAVRHELRLRLAAAGLLGTPGGLRWRLAPLILGRPEQEHREHVPKRSVMPPPKHGGTPSADNRRERRQRGKRYEPRHRREDVDPNGRPAPARLDASDDRAVSCLRRFGYKGRIESFEPLAHAHGELSARAAGDPLWTCHRLALGDTSGTLTLHVASNEVSSSALDLLPRHVQGDPHSSYVGSEQVSVRTLDELDLTDASDRAYLKADVQGFERRVLAGAGRTLESVHLLEVELSLVKLYEDGPLLADMLAYLKDLRFEPIWFERAFSDAGTGRLLQLDGIFAGSQR